MQGRSLNQFYVQDDNELRFQIYRYVDNIMLIYDNAVDRQDLDRLKQIAAVLRDCLGQSPSEQDSKFLTQALLERERLNFIKQLIFHSEEKKYQTRWPQSTAEAERLIANQLNWFDYAIKMLESGQAPQKQAQNRQNAIDCSNNEEFSCYRHEAPTTLMRCISDSASNNNSNDASSSQKSNSSDSDSDEAKQAKAVGLVILAAIAMIAAAFYAIPKGFKSLRNCFNNYKTLRSIWRLATMTGGSYGGVLVGAAYGSAFPIPILGTLCGAFIGMAVGAACGKYSAQLLSSFYYSHENNPTNPEKYRLSDTQKENYAVKGFDTEVINALLKETRGHNKSLGIMAHIPKTIEKENSKIVSELRVALQTGDIESDRMMKVNNHIYYVQGEQKSADNANTSAQGGFINSTTTGPSLFGRAYLTPSAPSENQLKFDPPPPYTSPTVTR